MGQQPFGWVDEKGAVTLNDAMQSGPVVLVGVDEGSEQQAVVRYAAQQASLHGSSLHILHVARYGGSAESGKQNTAERERTVVEPLAALAHSEFPGVPVTAEVASGQPAAVLLERSSEVAQLVVGHRGSGGFSRLPLGSVSWQVATHADCPVIVIRPAETYRSPDNGVVVGVDIDDVSREALDLAYTEADLRGGRLTMLHAAFHFGEMPTGPGMAAPNFEALDNAARKTLEAEAAKRRDRHPGVQVKVLVERVRPSTLLSEASRRAALLVVGDHRRTGLRRLVLGSVSTKILHTAACPVAVVPSTAGA